MTRAVTTLIVALVVGALSASTDPQQPARDGPAAAAARRIGTSVIAGLVTLGDVARTPVRRAVVTLTAADGSEKLAAISEDDGRFTIERVPAGRYTLGADKPAHLTIAYGAHRPGRRGTPLIVGDGQRLNDLTLSLPRGAVLAGRVTLPNGQPVSNVQVTAIPSWLTTGGGTPPAGREFRTDDLGEFRLFGLTPDTYVVAALPSFGRGEVERMPDSAISTVLRQLQQPGGAAPPAAGSPASVAYAPTYFPGTPSIGDARRITVAAGDVREDLSITISAFPAATIRGRVVGLDGAPTQTVALTLEGVGPALPAAATGVGRIAPPNRNGEFEVRGVSPGMYRLRARAGGVRLDANGAMAIRGDAQTQFAIADVNVAGANVDGVVLALQEGYRFAGTLATDGSAAAPPLTGASVFVDPIVAGPISVLAGAGMMPGVGSRDAEVDGAGHFTVTGLEPFNYEIRVTLPPALAHAGWHIDSIRYADRDLRDAPLTFTAGSLDDVIIRLTTTVTELSGRLTTDAGTPAADCFIVAFPSDRTLWHPTSPRVRVLRPAVDGTFSTQDLPAGVYRLAILTDVDAHDPREGAFLESIYEGSVEISLTAGRTTRQDLRVGRRVIAAGTPAFLRPHEG